MFEKRIITVHDVSEDTMTPQRFEKIIKTSLAIGYKFVSMKDILKKETKGLKLCLNIDDAYKSTITTILPILEKYNIVATLFVPTGLLGYHGSDKYLEDKDLSMGKSMMTWDDVHEWVRRGQDIGFHTHIHYDLYHHTNDEIKDDFEKGMAAFKEHNVDIKYFAYPKGFLPKDRKFYENLLEKYGIEYAFTVNRGKVNPENRYYVHRTLIGNKEKFLWSMCKVVGLEDIHYYKVKQKRHIEVKE